MIEERLKEIRLRAIEADKKKLAAKAAKLYPGDPKRQEKYVYRKLNARYGVGSPHSTVGSQQSTVSSWQFA